MATRIIILLCILLNLKSEAQYTFNTTNFDDGWVSTVKEDWVEVTKGSIRVLLHFPREGTIYPADPDPLTRAAWNILVAPRYKSLSNFKTVAPSDFNRAMMGAGNLVDAGGLRVYVALFRQGGGWMEFIAPDKETLTAEFGVDADKLGWNSDGAVFGKMAKMAGYNRFAVSDTDLSGTGKWSDHYSSSTFYVNTYTGANEGMSTYSSSQYFLFDEGHHYSWDLIAVNWYAGRSSIGNGKGAGSFHSVGNWQLSFSAMEGKQKLYDVYFCAVKSGRVLFMNDAKYPGSGVFKGFTKEVAR